MADPIDNITDTAKEIAQDAKDVIKQRFFSPMYFYFGISWIITNWKFVFAFLFIDSDDIYGEKLDYLVAFYPINWPWIWSDLPTTLWSISKLLIIPALSAYLFVWWFSRLSEKFYRRNETFIMNKESIKRGLVYNFKRQEKVESIELRELEVAERVVSYQDNTDFNEDYDSLNEIISLSGATLLPSQVLYDSDYDLYIETLNDFNLNKNKK